MQKDTSKIPPINNAKLVLMDPTTLFVPAQLTVLLAKKDSMNLKPTNNVVNAQAHQLNVLLKPTSNHVKNHTTLPPSVDLMSLVLHAQPLITSNTATMPLTLSAVMTDSMLIKVLVKLAKPTLSNVHSVSSDNVKTDSSSTKLPILVRLAELEPKLVPPKKQPPLAY